jgi:hypothetical protein
VTERALQRTLSKDMREKLGEHQESIMEQKSDWYQE